MRYLLLLYGDETAELSLGTEERRAIMQAHTAFAAAMRGRGWLLEGEPLQASSTAVVVREGGMITDGPFIETKEHMGGFWILEAANMDEALAWAKKAAIACDMPGEVRELLFYPAPEQEPGGSE